MAQSKIQSIVLGGHEFKLVRLPFGQALEPMMLFHAHFSVAAVMVAGAPLDPPPGVRASLLSMLACQMDSAKLRDLKAKLFYGMLVDDKPLNEDEIFTGDALLFWEVFLWAGAVHGGHFFDGSSTFLGGVERLPPKDVLRERLDQGAISQEA